MNIGAEADIDEAGRVPRVPVQGFNHRCGSGFVIDDYRQFKPFFQYLFERYLLPAQRWCVDVMIHYPRHAHADAEQGGSARACLFDGFADQVLDLVKDNFLGAANLDRYRLLPERLPTEVGQHSRQVVGADLDADRAASRRVQLDQVPWPSKSAAVLAGVADQTLSG